MTTKHYLSAFILSVLLVPGAAFVANAESNSTDDATLAELVEKLTERVEQLEKDLEKAEERIAALEKTGVVKQEVKYEYKEKVKAKWDGDKFQKGNQKVCHMGQTIEVSGWAAAAHVIHHQGDHLGECGHQSSFDDDDDDDSDEDDDSDDDDDSEDDDDDEDDD